MEHKATIVMPVYNEEKSLDEIIPKLREIKNDYEIIIIDDGSTDKTPELIKNSGFRNLCHPYNKGYGAALKTGIRNATSDVVVIMDSDGQHNPKDINKLMDYISDYDMVVGARDEKSRLSFWRRPWKKILGWVANYLAESKIPDLNSGFRGIKKEIAMKFMHILPNGFSFSTTITLAMLKAGYNVKYVPISTEKRVGRKSNVSFFKDGSRTLLIIIRATALFNPLKVFIPISFALFLFGFLFTIYGIVAYRSAPQIGAISILASIMIFFFGILADQISILRREKND